MKLQRQLSNGSWIDIDDEKVDFYIGRVLEKEAASAAYRPVMTSRDEVVAKLATGKTVEFDTDWYDELRDADAIKPRAPIALVHCDCGHDVPRMQVMSASRGTSCPECYDRMSD